MFQFLCELIVSEINFRKLNDMRKIILLAFLLLTASHKVASELIKPENDPYITSICVYHDRFNQGCDLMVVEKFRDKAGSLTV